MNAPRWRGCLPIFAATLLLISSTQAKAQGPNLALNKPCIDQSTQWNNTPQYNCQGVTDGIVCEMDQNEGGAGISSYWLGSEQLQFGQYVTVDMQAPTLIKEIHLRNTHNAQFNDRNTMDFQIEAGNVTAVGGTLLNPSVTIVDAVVILQGTMSSADLHAPPYFCPDDEIPADVFDKGSGLDTGGKAFRYIRFVTINSYHNNKDVGLNELEVYGSQ